MTIRDEDQPFAEREEAYRTRRATWLEENGYLDGDVMEDSLGREYVNQLNEKGVKEKIYIEDAIEGMD